MPPQRRRRTRRQNNAEEEEELSARPPPAVSTRRGRSRSRSPHQGNVRERNGNVRQRRGNIRQRNEHVERQHDNTRQRNENAGHERNESARGLLENVRQRNVFDGANVTISISVPSSGVQTASNGVAGEDVNRELDVALEIFPSEIFHSSWQASPPTLPQFLQDFYGVVRDTTANSRARILENLDIPDVIRQTTAQALQDVHNEAQALHDFHNEAQALHDFHNEAQALQDEDDDDGSRRLIIGDTSIAYEAEIDEYVHSSSETELSDSESNTSNSEESPSAAAADQRRRPFCLSEHVQEMPDVTVGGADMGSRCGVCIEDFEMGERDVIRLPCSHLHHRECFQQWVGRDNRSCPVCRQDVARELQEGAATAAHSS